MLVGVEDAALCPSDLDVPKMRFAIIVFIHVVNTHLDFLPLTEIPEPPDDL